MRTAVWSTLRVTAAALIAAAAAVVGLPMPASAVLARLSDDTHASSSARTSNFGSAPTLLVQGPGPTAAQTYMRFDLTTLPAGTRGADVARAVLRLWVAKVTRPGMFDVHSVRGGWSEDALTAANAPGRGRDELLGIQVSGAGPEPLRPGRRDGARPGMARPDAREQRSRPDAERRRRVGRVRQQGERHDQPRAPARDHAPSHGRRGTSRASGAARCRGCARSGGRARAARVRLVPPAPRVRSGRRVRQASRVPSVPLGLAAPPGRQGRWRPPRPRAR